MPYGECDPEDPMELIGIEIPAEDEATMVQMAECFVEEFVRMGWPAGRILSLFMNPFYVGPHQVYRAKGDKFVSELIEAAIALWRPRQAL